THRRRRADRGRHCRDDRCAGARRRRWQPRSRPMTARLDHDWFDRPLPHGVRLGEGSWLHSAYAFLHCVSRKPCPLSVGAKSGVYRGTFFDLGPDGEVEIGDYCTVVGAIFAVNGRLTIGDYGFIAHEVVIADSPWSITPTADSDPPRGPETRI